MKRSKLETYFDILDVLSINGPLMLTHVMYKTNVNCSILKGNLDFLKMNNLVEERIMKNERVVYFITQKGMAILKAFREIKQVFRIYEEENRKSPILF